MDSIVSPDTKAVLLDVDGTLVDSNDLHAKAWVDAIEKHGFSAPYERVRRLIGMGADNLLPTLLGLNDQTAPGKLITEDRGKIFREKYLAQVKPFPQVREMLEKMRSMNYKLVVATSALKEDLQKILEMGKIDDLLPDRVNSDDADNSKPDPDILVAALKKAGVTAKQALMIGDTPYDISAARKAGIPAFGFTCGGWESPSLKNEGANAVFESPAEFLKYL